MPERIDQGLPGVAYLDFLARYHELVGPESYFEIGTALGNSLRLATCPKVAVDPRFRLNIDPIGASPAAHLFQMTSDEFFAKHDVRHFLPSGIACAFLDGLHLFEFLLRDFMNTEKHARPDSVFFLHDCYPINDEITGRTSGMQNRRIAHTSTWWAGDVWKVLPILREFRPDLDVRVLDCPPTGLVVVRGMNPESDVLQASYAAILSRFTDLTLGAFGLGRLHAEFPLVQSQPLHAADAFRAFFGMRGTCASSRTDGAHGRSPA